MENIDLNALFKLTYGLYVISSSDGNKKSGFIGNAVMQLTPCPVRIAVCSSKNNYTTKLIKESQKLSISVLNINTSKDIIGSFGYKSGTEINKFDGVKHFIDEDNIPVLTENTIAWFTGDVVGECDIDSHILFTVEIKKCEIMDNYSEPMTYEYYRNVYKGKSPKNAPTYIDKSKTEISDIRKDIWVCDLCKYEYNPEIGDPDSGIAPGTAFEDLPEDWICPVCAKGKEEFKLKGSNNKKKNSMSTDKKEIWVCDICGYEYDPTVGDPDSGIAPGTAFEDIPDNWMCPICGVEKSDFSKK